MLFGLSHLLKHSISLFVLELYQLLNASFSIHHFFYMNSIYIYLYKYVFLSTVNILIRHYLLNYSYNSLRLCSINLFPQSYTLLIVYIKFLYIIPFSFRIYLLNKCSRLPYIPLSPVIINHSSSLIHCSSADRIYCCMVV